MKLHLFQLILLGQCGVIFCHLFEYHYINVEKNWTEAQQYCRENHTDLATVSDMEGLKRLLRKSPGRTEAWIGLYDQTHGTRRWYWSLPGVEFNKNETGWDSKQPDDAYIENCGSLFKSLKWNDLSCGRHEHFLCYDERNTSEKFYLIKQEKTKTWLEAQSYCRENHTDLLSGLDQLQGEPLKNVLSSTDGNVFMGLFRDSWRWSDGSGFSFRHWSKEFNDERYNSGQCAMAGFDDGGRWKNEICTVRKPFICYDEKLILIKENKTWEEALYYCRDHHHDLVTITNLDEQRWIQEKAKKASTDYVWMGLRYACTLDFWFWVSDEVVSYKNWAPDEPMDDCDMSGAMETGGKHQWLKINDQMEFNFVCSV